VQLLVNATEEARIAARRRAQLKLLGQAVVATIPSTRDRGVHDAGAMPKCAPQCLIEATRALE